MIDLEIGVFEKFVTNAIDNIPKKYADHIKNLAFVVEDDPSHHQRQKLHLHEGMTLFGLYEGVPLTQRSGNYSGVLPDKITIFRNPITARCSTTKQVIDQVNKTVWHEVAHHFGLNHERINWLESK